ncbi:MAG: deoxyribose-phosphate aldolase [Mycolicibacterium insubricum]|uniref:Deoxyribose-phosphate aldolase n=1 Tax=Mycolicibacterium insubricum TaxID=444597 RepID=A0A1X0DDC5_9MYCO|nr:deoxyribose-phosphate aldolase [Mycolicibacterium insubricum]MCV7081190.1 deoxyribose-phosphate aldolase [Mycolicibacterium insubricum]ORA70394.1 deoxyribose-phosphate aldolase [Mycolicibacterium insubricum]
MNRAAVAALIDHTLLKPEATPAQVDALVAEAAALGVFSVCVSPSMLPIRAPHGLAVATVCGFPSGAHQAGIKAAEAADSVARGADEVDMVINLANAVTGDFDAVRDEIASVRRACPAPVLLKVIIESAALTDAQIVGCCRAAEAAGADFVKTSTGFHPSGGASVHAVALMADTVGGRLGVKASGGIRTAADALAMIDAGATRLGLSSSAAVLAGLAE